MVLVRSGLEGMAFIRGLVCCPCGTPEFHRPAHSVAGGAAPHLQVLQGIRELPAWKMRSPRLFSVGLRLPGGRSRGQSWAAGAKIVISNSAFR